MKSDIKSNQSGMAAITVTLIILGIVTLITVGFATLMRREQRQALDQQLSTQAFYAAESGVNAARDYIDSTPADDIEESDDCDTSPVSGANLSASVAYSCVLLDVTPTVLRKTVDTDTSWVTKIQRDDGNAIGTLEISWQMSPDTQSFADPSWVNGHLLPPASEWGDRTGILRMMLMRDTNDRTSLIRDTYHAFLYPNAASGLPTAKNLSGPLTRTDQGEFLNGNCSVTPPRTPYYCQVLITGLTQTSYYLRLKSIYNTSDVTVRALTGSNPVELRNGQAQIDATGRAADVLRRIQVNVPLETGDYPYPEFALETFSTLCKRFFTWPGGSATDLSTIPVGTTSLTADQIAACSL